MGVQPGGLFSPAGNVVGGALSDRGGREWVFTIGSAIAVVGIGRFSLLRGPTDLAMLFIYVASGVGFGMRISQLTTIPADLFHGPAFDAIVGFATVAGVSEDLSGPFLGGSLFDVTGSYRTSFAVSALAITGAAIAA